MSAPNEVRQLRHEHHNVPVTAVEFFSDRVLLAGEGTCLVAYNTDRKSQLGSIQVFRSQAIHRILVNQTTGDVLIYGGSLVALIKIQDEDAHVTFDILGLKDTGDWIFDATFYSSSNYHGTTSVALITAHNALVKCSFEKSQDSDGTVEITTSTIVPGSNCILYCAHISWLSPSLCLIASGTAFGDIILWSCSFDATDANAVVTKTHYTFSAHEGSVFGVQISSNLQKTVLGGPSRVLASCSDDRTVRLWDISDLNCEASNLTDIQRETGFGSSDQDLSHAPPLLAKALGHISRIWTIRFAWRNADGKPGTCPLAVTSFGEDGSRITWELKSTASDTSQHNYELRQSHVHQLHTGKNIWSATVEGARCATGGADGSIAMLPAMETGPVTFEISNDLLFTASDEPSSSGKESFKSYALVDADTLVATTGRGRIAVLTLERDGTTSLKDHGSHQSLSSFSMVTSTSQTAFIAGVRGSVHMYSHRTKRCEAVAPISGKVAGMFVSERPGIAISDDAKVPSVLVTTVNTSVAQLTYIDVVVDEGGLENYKSEHKSLELPPGFVVTSFQLVRCGNRDFALVGARNGSLVAYDLRTTQDVQAVAPCHTVTHCHAKDAITSMHWRASEDGESGFLFSTGRDSTYAVRQITLQESLLSFKLVHQLELPFGPNIEGLAFTDNSHLQIWGFRGKNFVVHDATTQQDISTVQCGGGVHRNWAYEPSTTGGTFVWSQASTLMRTTQTELPHQSIHAGRHGREIKALAILAGAHQIIATGAEDTDVKLFSHSSKQGLTCLQTLRRHNTGIQHLRWSKDGRYLFSSAGSEEFHVWRVSHGVPMVSVGVVCESSHPRSGKSDLRIMGFDAIERATGEQSAAAFDITMVYSDSSIKRWEYRCGDWTLRASGDYLTACLTNVLHLQPSIVDSQGEVSLTAATDGHIALWKAGSEESPTWQQRSKVHQNAILDVSSETLPDGSTLLVTAGDDNGIGISRIQEDNAVSVLVIPRAHAAAVTALALHKISDGHYYLISAGIDQRVKLWNVQIDVDAKGIEGILVQKAQNVSTSVADISSMGILQLEDGSAGVLVCGVGMDVWRLA